MVRKKLIFSFFDGTVRQLCGFARVDLRLRCGHVSGQRKDLRVAMSLLIQAHGTANILKDFRQASK